MSVADDLFDKPADDAPESSSSTSTFAVWAFAVGVLAVMLAACFLAGWTPLGFSILTVFLFAGPHNWSEARYFLSRMPARWGRLMGFFALGIGGTIVLTGAFAAIPWLGSMAGWQREEWLIAYATWNTVFMCWILTLVYLRSRQNPKRDWSWVYPIGFSLLALNWLWPQAWDLALVYIHPCIALWFLDRELGERKPEWQPAYRACLMVLPLLLGLLWWQTASLPSLPGADALSMRLTPYVGEEHQEALNTRITQHAGAGILDNISTHLLVSTHTFLEMLHYGVWLVAIPLVAWREEPWNLEHVPLARDSSGWRWFVIGVLCLGGITVLGFWAGFAANYPMMRDIYFTVAMLHVLAEVPFLAAAPMTPERLWAGILGEYFVTISIEAPILFFGLSPRHSWQTRVIAGFWLTACTYPIVWLVLPLTIYPEWGYGIYLAVAEIFAPAAERLLFYFAFARDADIRASEAADSKLPLDEAPVEAKPVVATSPYDTWRDMATIIAANLASFLLGMWMQTWGQ